MQRTIRSSMPSTEPSARTASRCGAAVHQLGSCAGSVSPATQHTCATNRCHASAVAPPAQPDNLNSQPALTAAGGAVAAAEPAAAAGAQQLPVWSDQRGLCALRPRLLARHAARHHRLRVSRCVPAALARLRDIVRTSVLTGATLWSEQSTRRHVLTECCVAPLAARDHCLLSLLSGLK